MNDTDFIKLLLHEIYRAAKDEGYDMPDLNNPMDVIIKEEMDKRNIDADEVFCDNPTQQASEIDLTLETHCGRRFKNVCGKIIDQKKPWETYPWPECMTCTEGKLPHCIMPVKTYKICLDFSGRIDPYDVHNPDFESTGQPFVGEKWFQHGLTYIVDEITMALDNTVYVLRLRLERRR